MEPACLVPCGRHQLGRERVLPLIGRPLLVCVPLFLQAAPLHGALLLDPVGGSLAANGASSGRASRFTRSDAFKAGIFIRGAICFLVLVVRGLRICR